MLCERQSFVLCVCVRDSRLCCVRDSRLCCVRDSRLCCVRDSRLCCVRDSCVRDSRLCCVSVCERQSFVLDSTYHGLCYISRGAMAGTVNSPMGPP